MCGYVSVQASAKRYVNVCEGVCVREMENHEPKPLTILQKCGEV